MDSNAPAYLLIAICVGAFIVRMATRNRPEYRDVSRLSVLLIMLVFVGLVGYLGLVFVSAWIGGVD